MIHFRYNGEAVGKGRPRVSRKGGYVHTYTPEKTRAFEEAIYFEFLANNCEKLPVYESGIPLVAEILIGVGIPKSYSKKKHALCLCRMVAPTKKPDTDNIVKSILDALGSREGGAFDDDSQVVKIIAEKVYAESPFVDVRIYRKDTGE